ncbi:MAG: hypothetical protein V4496_04120 [Pseudomonadota bacterium]
MLNTHLIKQQIKLDNLDFTMVKLNLCLPNEEGGFEWPIEEVDKAISAYFNFLKMISDMIPERILVGPIYFSEAKIFFEKAVPNTIRHNVAIVWERHILNTRQYIEDCQRLFGVHLHYSPTLLKNSISITDIAE